MARLTKQAYNKQRAALLAQLSLARAEVARIIDTALDAEGDKLNELHDRVDDTERAIRDLDNAWATRQWTGQDWRAWALVVANVD